MTTCSIRRATPVPVSPIKQAMMVNVAGAGKATTKRTARKVLADKTNATPVAAVPRKSPMKAAAAQEASTPSRRRLSEEQPLGTPATKGEEPLLSLEHCILSTTQIPNGLASQSTEAETPQFGVPLSPYQEDAPSPSPVKSGLTTVSEHRSSEWVRRDVDEVTEVDDGDDSDCSVLVNVSSPGMHLATSPAPASPPPTTPQTADFKWQRRDSRKVKEPEVGECGFNYYEDDGEDYDEYDGEDFGVVIDCEEICQGISRIQVAEGLPGHKGCHIRFNYNSDDEIDVEEVDVMRLRGLPTPMGKHLRFPEDENALLP